jgi:hypothetical protein
MHEGSASQSIGNDFFDFGGGNSRSRSIRSSFVNLISIERALSNLDFYFGQIFFQAAAAKTLSICQAEGMKLSPRHQAQPNLTM